MSAEPRKRRRYAQEQEESGGGLSSILFAAVPGVVIVGAIALVCWSIATRTPTTNRRPQEELEIRIPVTPPIVDARRVPKFELDQQVFQSGISVSDWKYDGNKLVGVIKNGSEIEIRGNSLIGRTFGKDGLVLRVTYFDFPGLKPEQSGKIIATILDEKEAELVSISFR